MLSYALPHIGCAFAVPVLRRVFRMATLQSQFEKFCVFGASQGSTSGGPQIALSNIDKWFKQAGVFTKAFTPTDTGIHFGKLR